MPGGLMQSLFGTNSNQDRRKHLRVEPNPKGSVEVMIDRTAYNVQNISISGFLIKGYDGSLIERQRFQFRYRFNFDGKIQEYSAEGMVVRLDNNGLAARVQPGQPAVRRDILRSLAKLGLN